MAPPSGGSRAAPRAWWRKVGGKTGGPNSLIFVWMNRGLGKSILSNLGRANWVFVNAVRRQNPSRNCPEILTAVSDIRAACHSAGVHPPLLSVYGDSPLSVIQGSRSIKPYWVVGVVLVVAIAVVAGRNGTKCHVKLRV